MLIRFDHDRDNLHLSTTNSSKPKNLLNGKDDSIKYIAVENENLDFKELTIRIG